jgi:hypothetical protein
VPVEDVAHGGSPLLAEAITRLRAGRVIRQADSFARTPRVQETSMKWAQLRYSRAGPKRSRCRTLPDFVAHFPV